MITKNIIAMGVFFCFLVNPAYAFLPVCDRTLEIQEVIVDRFKLPISDCDLVTNMSIKDNQHIFTETLYFHDLKISSLTVGDFDGFDEIEVLYLSQNQISTLPLGIFDALTSLEKLDLDSNILTSISSELFLENKNLNHLILSNNKLQNLPDDLLDLLPSLFKLDLSNNELTTLPVDFFKNVKSNAYFFIILKGNPISASELDRIEKVSPKNVLIIF